MGPRGGVELGPGQLGWESWGLGPQALCCDLWEGVDLGSYWAGPGGGGALKLGCIPGMEPQGLAWQGRDR